MVQSVLLFGAEGWVLSEVVSMKLEGVFVGFLWRITRQRAEQQKDGTWRQMVTDTVLEKSGPQPLGT